MEKQTAAGSEVRRGPGLGPIRQQLEPKTLMGPDPRPPSKKSPLMGCDPASRRERDQRPEVRDQRGPLPGPYLLATVVPNRSGRGEENRDDRRWGQSE